MNDNCLRIELHVTVFDQNKEDTELTCWRKGGDFSLRIPGYKIYICAIFFVLLPLFLKTDFIFSLFQGVTSGAIKSKSLETDNTLTRPLLHQIPHFCTQNTKFGNRLALTVQV